MPVRARLGPLPGAPRWVLVPVAVLATAEVVAAVVPGLRPRADSPGLTVAHLGTVLALHACLCVVLLWRARAVAHERSLWRRLSERSLAVVAALDELGATVSIDDFGTGWSSLTYLRELPLGELKLDRSFTADLLTDPRAAAIVASTIALAHDLGLRVVAEGVEQEATLARLQLLGCDESQGYLHSRPLPAAELCGWLLRHSARHGMPALH